jgi:RNA polymerase sigma-70 factor (ECF subfamily)
LAGLELDGGYVFMVNEGDELIPTRASFLGRLKNSKDQSSWQEFFDTYSGLIYGVARKAGLNDADAKYVLEATIASVADHMPTFKYDSKNGSFKAWLRNLTRLQIVSLTLKGRPASGATNKAAATTPSDSTVEAVDQLWEAEWKSNLLNAAVANVKRRLDPKKYQIYDLQVNKGLAPEKLAALMGKSAEEILEAKRDIAEMIQAEMKRLEEKMI